MSPASAYRPSSYTGGFCAGSNTVGVRIEVEGSWRLEIGWKCNSLTEVSPSVWIFEVRELSEMITTNFYTDRAK